MKAMVLHKTVSLKDNKHPLEFMDVPIPIPKFGEVLIKVSVCGVCHTELDEIEGRLPPPIYPVVLGHQVVGRVTKRGKNSSKFKVGDRVGVAWIFSACGTCRFCLAGNENLCDDFKGTGKDVNGGYAEYMTVPEKYANPIPNFFRDAEAAPLLCAGAIGYRSVQLAQLENGQNLGLTGFGASAHLVLKMVRHRYPQTKVYVFARKKEEQMFAKDLGAVWAGDTTDTPPEKLDCIIDTTPAWKPVVEALGNLDKGGRLVINAIGKEEADKTYLQKLSYPADLWLEKEIKTVANVTGNDVSEFLKLATQASIKPHTKEYPLKEANKALLELKEGLIKGAKVIRIA